MSASKAKLNIFNSGQKQANGHRPGSLSLLSLRGVPAGKLDGDFSDDDAMSLHPRKIDLLRLENLCGAGEGNHRARCPACAELGHDSDGDNLFIYPNGNCGCAKYQKDNRHKKRIYELAGIGSQNALKTDQAPHPKPLAKSASTPLLKSKIIATYSYEDEQGNELFQVLRLEPKSFRQRHQVNGHWIWDMKDVRRVPYKLPSIIASSWVVIVEGEKDVETVSRLGYVATCNPGGAGKWLGEWAPIFAGKDVFLIPDHDEPGREHMRQVAESLQGVVNSLWQIEVPAL